ncbi:PREDICTED: uncharacterized protein LOC109359735 [Lupinus angustifolius]|uniref:uncharacterized protein LOC109359735 n=1 Tax=Lupinus angustifolius TaxID=3871 RepID=UPI00092E84F1|nr:PREDICTED: uncharacterized protein LOC109359735 [Lupinus angustifolius]
MLHMVMTTLKPPQTQMKLNKKIERNPYLSRLKVWHLEKTKKVIVELNGYGQGNDNGSNLLVRFLGLDCADWTAFVHHYKEDKMKKQSLANTRSRKVSHAGGSMSNAMRGRQMLKLQRPVCRGEVVLSTLLKKGGSYVSEEGKTLYLKLSALNDLLSIS